MDEERKAWVRAQVEEALRQMIDMGGVNIPEGKMTLWPAPTAPKTEAEDVDPIYGVALKPNGFLLVLHGEESIAAQLSPEALINLGCALICVGASLGGGTSPLAGMPVGGRA